MHYVIENLDLILAVIGILLALFTTDRIVSRNRKWLTNTSRGLVRYFKARALIGAIRGKSAETELKTVAMILIMLLLAGVQYTRDRESDFRVARLHLIESLSALEAASEPPVQRDLASSLKEALEVAESGIELTHTALEAGHVLFFVLLLIWYPYLVVRRVYTHEVERFSRWIGGIASKDEITRVALLEARVLDTTSLRQYARATIEVASLHGVLPLAEPFNIWGDKTS